MYPCEFNKNTCISIVSRDRVQINRFWSKFDILMSPVTLEIRSRSPKSNPLIPLVQWCIHVSMIRIHWLVYAVWRWAYTVFMLSVISSLRDSVIPWFRLRFRSISWEQIDGIWPNFVHVLILTISRLGLLCVNFRKFIIELWPLIDFRISFPLNILRTNWWNVTKFCLYIGNT